MSWEQLGQDAEDQQACELLEQQIFPGSDHVRGKSDSRSPAASRLRPTRFGESFDGLLSSAKGEVVRIERVHGARDAGKMF